jgi:hypothetical protein
MTQAITLWLAFVLAAGAVAWFGNKRQALAFVIIAALTAPASFMTLGHPSITKPPAGEHTVLGARIDVDEAIYVLLDDAPEPKYYRLPYSQGAANQLQAALDGAADGVGGVAMRMGEDGSPGFAETAPPPEPEKRGERAIIGG